jgi:hypothetical protein
MVCADYRLSQMLENLVIAVESDAQVVDIGRVSGFMQKAGLLPIHYTFSYHCYKVRDGII